LAENTAGTPNPVALKCVTAMPCNVAVAGRGNCGRSWRHVRFPLLCPMCGGQRRLIAFITEGAQSRKIPDHIGVNSEPPHIDPARGPPLWDDCSDAQMDDGAQIEGFGKTPSQHADWRLFQGAILGLMWLKCLSVVSCASVTSLQEVLLGHHRFPCHRV
jgi:hypothetical protein